MTSRRRARWILPGCIAVNVMVASEAAYEEKLRALARSAKKNGLRGYDAVDKLDIWPGRDIPDFSLVNIIVDILGNSDGEVTAEDFRIAGLPVEHFEYFDGDQDGIWSIDDSMRWFMQRKSGRSMDLSERASPPRGHLKRLGAWKEPLPSDDLVYHKPYPHPRDFWKKHMDGYLPALLKGAQNGWPCMDWTKEVLQQRFGWVDAKLEPKVEGRGNKTAYRELDRLAPNHRLNISEYLRVEEGKNVYVVSILPQPMAWEVAHPSVLLCGSREFIADKSGGRPYKIAKHPYRHERGHAWMTHIFETNLWIASGKTRSQLHYDKEWNVNCLLRGKKRWFFLNPFDYSEDLHWARGGNFRPDDPLNNRWTDWVYLDPDAVDLIVQNRLRDMDYYEIIQEAGDCVFLPYAMLHQVEKLTDDLQVGVSWMFLPETLYDEVACRNAPVAEDLPLAALDTLYMYTGTGLIPQGYNDPLNFIQEVARGMRKHKYSHLTLDVLTAVVSQEDAILATARDKRKRISKIYDLITAYAEDPSKGLRIDELGKVPLRLWCKPAAEGDPEGPLPCDAGQEYFFCDDEEFRTMEETVQRHLAKQAAAAPVPTAAAPEKLLAIGSLSPPRVWKPSRRQRPRRKRAREAEL